MAIVRLRKPKCGSNEIEAVVIRFLYVNCPCPDRKCSPAPIMAADAGRGEAAAVLLARNGCHCCGSTSTTTPSSYSSYYCCCSGCSGIHVMPLLCE
jgi:hypothetical protein